MDHLLSMELYIYRKTTVLRTSGIEYFYVFISSPLSYKVDSFYLVLRDFFLSYYVL